MSITITVFNTCNNYIFFLFLRWNKKIRYLDHIYSNTTHMVNSSGVLHIGISDHSLIYCVRNFPSFKTSKRGKTIKYRCLKKFNLNLFLADLERVPWNNIFNFDDPNSMWTT